MTEQTAQTAQPTGLTAAQAARVEALGRGWVTWTTAHTGHLLVACLLVALALRVLGRRRPGPAQAATALRKPAAQHARAQGRVAADELARALPLPKDGYGVPLGYTGGRRPKAVGVPWAASRGHVGLFGPTGSGKGFHLTDALSRWPGSALIVDPKGEQWRRTAGLRAGRYGPVYRLPPAGFDLATMFDLGDAIARRELFECLLRPHLDREPHWLERVYPLFEAAHLTAQATGQHPLRLLARWAGMPPAAVAEAARPHAPGPVTMFTGGQPSSALADNRGLDASWAAFTSRLAPVAEQIGALALAPAEGGVPAQWAEQRATVYLCWPIHSQGAVGPLVAALVAGVLRRLEAAPPPHRTLLALDEAPTVGLPRLSNYLATIRGETGGVTAVVYCQSLSQLEAVYGRPEAEAILSNCAAGQVFLPPKDLQTADYLSRLFGEALEPVATASGGEQSGATRAGWAGGGAHQRGRSTSWSVTTRYRRALTEAQALALPEGAAAVNVNGYRALLWDSRTVLGGRLAQLPPPPPTPARATCPARASGAAELDDAPLKPSPKPRPKAGETTPPAAAEALW